jgi:hypothetical protein
VPLVILINRPASETPPDAICIGPTAVDMSCVVDESARRAAIAKTEAGQMKRWRRSDFATYSHQTQRGHWKH